MSTKTRKPGLLKSAMQTWARWAGIPVGAGNGTDYNLEARRDWEIDCVTPRQAMKLSAVRACTTFLGDAVSMLPAEMMEKKGTERVPAPDHPLTYVFSTRPNANMTAQNFLRATIMTMLLRDAAYWEKITSGGIVVGLNFLVRDCLSVTCGPDGVKTYRYTRYGKTREIAEADIIPIMGATMDGENGISTIEYGARVFGSATAAEEAASSTFKRGLLPTVGFMLDTFLKKDQRTEFRENLKEVTGALNAGKSPLLEGGMKPVEIGINPNDAQLLESRQYSREEICSWFRVPPWAVGFHSEGVTNWGTGLEQQMIGLITFTIGPIIKTLEVAANAYLLTPAERGRYYLKIDVRALLRGDSAARQALYASASQNGWMNRDEIRALEDLPKIPNGGGEAFTVQANLVEIGKLGASSPITEAQKALRTILDLEPERTP